MFLFWKENCAMCNIWAKGVMVFIILSKDFVTLLPPPADSAAEFVAVSGFRGYDTGLRTQTESHTVCHSPSTSVGSYYGFRHLPSPPCYSHSEKGKEDSTFSWRTQSDRRQTDRKETSEYSMVLCWNVRGAQYCPLNSDEPPTCLEYYWIRNLFRVIR